jgi:MFS family permease
MTAPGYRWRALAIVSLGTLTVHLDTTVNVALPAITAALQAPITAIQWIIIGYVLTTAATLVGVGRLTDLVGRRAIWTCGLIALGLALLLDSQAPSIEFLVLFRILQAVGATMLYAAGPAIITEAFPRRQRGWALGIMTMGGQIGTAIGPPLGGWLVATFGWPAIFWGRAPIALLLGVASFWRSSSGSTRPARLAGARRSRWRCLSRRFWCWPCSSGSRRVTRPRWSISPSSATPSS